MKELLLNLPTIVKVQILIGIVSVVITVFAAHKLEPLLKERDKLIGEKSQLEQEVSLLQIKKLELQGSVNHLISDFNENKPKNDKSKVASLFTPRASSTILSGVFDPKGRQVYKLTAFLDVGSFPLPQPITKVVYDFDHPTFKQPIMESSNVASGYAVTYNGWGCLSAVGVSIYFKDGSSTKLFFDMCAALGWQ